jgi:hypothetical protein
MREQRRVEDVGQQPRLRHQCQSLQRRSQRCAPLWFANLLRLAAQPACGLHA